MIVVLLVICLKYGFLKIDYNGSIVFFDGNVVGLKFMMVDLILLLEFVVCVYYVVWFYIIICFLVFYILIDWIVCVVIDFGDIFLGCFFVWKLDVVGNYDGFIVFIIVEGKMGILVLKIGKVCIRVVFFVVFFVRLVFGI